jgi:glycosyltransferase involved in cell wall biosynthesis
MKKLKEVTVFTNGDSSQISTWSNVPYFFTETLLSMGIKVNRVDISASPELEIWFNRIFYRILSKINKNTSYSYFRSLTNFVSTRNKISKAVEKYQNSEADIFITFSFSSIGLTRKPIIQFCDWTYGYELEHFLVRSPDFFEKQAVRREDSQIIGSDLIFCLFPSVAEYMKRTYPGKNINYLGNVINSLYEVSEDDMSTKSISNSLLFVGSKKYIEGAKALILAFQDLKYDYPLLSLNIIGMQSSDFVSLPKDVFCHGYLDKGDTRQRELYYKIFKGAKIFINTTPKWGAFSASIEAMYFYTPVIVTPYSEFVNTFGQDIPFGHYCETNSVSLIKEKILDILHNNSYQQLCFDAHDAVKEFTWNAYIGKIVERVELAINK